MKTILLTFSSAPTRQATKAALGPPVAEAIYQLRLEAGLSQSQLAAMLGIAQPTISKIEDPDYTGDRLNMLCRVLAAVGGEVTLEGRQ